MIILSVFAGVLFVLLIIFASLKRSDHQVTESPTLTPTLKQEKFNITSTSPENRATNVTPGEIAISFITDKPIVSKNSFSFSINPAVPNYWKLVDTTYPTKKITAQVFGVLAPSTLYTVSVTDSSNQYTYSWTFTTSDKPAQSSSGLVREEEKKLVEDYYPLLSFVPYDSQNFSIDYIDRLSLVVQMKNNDSSQVRSEVTEWIRSKGVDPSTHTIQFESSP